ncbi:MAG: hypothetical protein IJ246_05575 [Clostridia bacterium]|nr:hypothetical protein [Clostridia bacterium]
MRVMFFAIALAIAVGAFAFGIYHILHADSGWTVIEADKGSGLSCADDFVLQYKLGERNRSAATERKAIAAAYTRGCVLGWQLMTPHASIADTVNIWWLNHHPNETTQVHPMLYQAMEASLKSGPWLYLGPLYELADALMASESDEEAAAYDPRLDADSHAFREGVMEMILSGDAIALELLGNDTVRLNVSDEYLAFADNWGVTRFIDFSWQKNAWITDWIADMLEEEGYTDYVLTCRQGFVRGCSEEPFIYQMYAWQNGELVPNVRIPYSGKVGAVHLRAFPLETSRSYYVYRSGAIRTLFLSLEDGLDTCSAEQILAFAQNQSCTEMFLKMLPLWICDTWTEDMMEILQSLSDVYYLAHSGMYETNAAVP